MSSGTLLALLLCDECPVARGLADLFVENTWESEERGQQLENMCGGTRKAHLFAVIQVVGEESADSFVCRTADL